MLLWRNKNMKIKTLLFASILMALPLMAADEKTATPPPSDGPARATGRMGAPLSNLAAFEGLLTPEQKQKLREYNQANGKKSQMSQQQALQMRRDLQNAVLSGQADEATIKEKTTAIAKLEGEAFAGRLLGMAEIAKTFTPEQKEKIKAMSDQTRAARPGLGAGPRGENAVRTPGEPAAPPPPAK